MEWNNDLIFEFLNLYQNEPTLWNSSAPDHKNKSDAFDAWNRIKMRLKDGTISVKELKKKRDNLMSTYRRQRTKVRESMGTGSGADDVYKPEWPFYDTMATFLNTIYKPKKTKSSEDPLYSEEIEEDEHDNDTSTTATTVQPATTEQPVTMEQPATLAQPATFKTPKTSEKNKSKRSRLNECDELKKRSEEAYNIMKQMSQTESDTSLLYCNLLCNKLRDLRESTRDIAMMEIDKIMYTLKQRDKHARNFPNSVYQNISLPISQQLYNSQPSPQYQVALQSPGYSHSSNSQPSPGYHHSYNSQPSPGYIHSSNSLPSPQYQVSLQSPGYPHSSNSQPSPQYQVSLQSPGYPHSSNSQPSPQHEVSLPSPGYSHSSNSQPSPQHEVSLPSPGYSHSSNSQPSPGCSHSYNSQPPPGNTHSSNSLPSPQYQVSLQSPGYLHSSNNSQLSLQHHVSLQTPGEVHSSNPQPSPGSPQSSISQCQFLVLPPGDVNSSNSQPPQQQHSLLPGLQLKQYYENTMFD